MDIDDSSYKIGLLTIVLSFGLLFIWPNLLVEGAPFETILHSQNKSLQSNTNLEELIIAETEPYYTFNSSISTFVDTPILIEVKKVIATAYSSTPDQTDGDPFITASGAYVYDGVLANNSLAFGTKVKIPEIFNDKIFIVEDRMNERFDGNRIDIWFPDRASAKQFGVKETIIEILSH